MEKSNVTPLKPKNKTLIIQLRIEQRQWAKAT